MGTGVVWGYVCLVSFGGIGGFGAVSNENWRSLYMGAVYKRVRRSSSTPVNATNPGPGFYCAPSFLYSSMVFLAYSSLPGRRRKLEKTGFDYKVNDVKNMLKYHMFLKVGFPFVGA